MAKNNKELLKVVVDAILDKKGEDIKILDISEISVIADYFVIANGNNIHQNQNIADEIEEKLHKEGLSLRQIEGYDSANWILMDFNDIIIHIFNKENRLFYDLERIWADGKLIDSSELTKIE